MKQEVFVARQPILTTASQPIGYEFLFRSSATAASAEARGLAASIQVVRNVLLDGETNWLLGDKLAFINVDAAALCSDVLHLLPPKRVVLEIACDVTRTPEVATAAENLADRGFSLCLDDFSQDAASAPLMEFASYVKLDALRLSKEELTELARQIDPRAKKLVATRVETREVFQHGVRAGIKLFQGYYFAKPETLSAKVVNPGVLAIMELMRLVRGNADVKKLEEALKGDATLLFKLLRYVNSPAVGLARPVQSLREAVALLGYGKLYRWLGLLFATAGTGSAATAIAKTAITRGFIAESLAAAAFNVDVADELFMVGAFSLLEAMFDTPKEKIVAEVMLPPEVHRAIVARQGSYAPVLDLIETCEREDMSRLEELAASLHLSAAEINRAHLSALARVEQLGM
jgi:c-di-GMP phosphodiesterase